MLPKTEIIEMCRKEDGYKDKCLRIPIEGCKECWYYGIKIVESRS